MKPENIEEQKALQKKSAARGALLFAVIQVASAACFGALCLIPDLPKWGFVLFAVLAVGFLATLIPVRLVLRARFKEIEGGELDAAGQY